jgi:hypothetical protein
MSGSFKAGLLPHRADKIISLAMDIVRAADQPTHSPARSNFRDGGIHFTPLHRGNVGELGFYTMAQVRFDEYYTPRHRHNYEQIRVGLKGSSPIGRNHDIPEGWVAYHPEGTPYGPQDIKVDFADSPVVLAWQFGGPSLQGFYPASELHSAYLELSETGRFDKGVYITTDADGKEHRRDGYEAAWSHYVGRPMQYPPPRYDAPVLMNPASFAWTATEHNGVASKTLGAFGEAGLRIWMVRVQPGCVAPLPVCSAARCGYVRHGAISVDGERFGAHSALNWAPGEAGELTGGDETAEVLLVDLPDLVRLQATLADAQLTEV